MSLLEELKKNDLYAPYAKKLDLLLKGGPGSGRSGGGGKDLSPEQLAAIHANSASAVKGANKTATRASNRAMNSGTAKDHIKAANLHRLAASTNKEAAKHNPQKAALLKATANKHLAAARYHESGGQTGTYAFA